MPPPSATSSTKSAKTSPKPGADHTDDTTQPPPLVHIPIQYQDMQTLAFAQPLPFSAYKSVQKDLIPAHYILFRRFHTCALCTSPYDGKLANHQYHRAHACKPSAINASKCVYKQIAISPGYTQRQLIGLRENGKEHIARILVSAKAMNNGIKSFHALIDISTRSIARPTNRLISNPLVKTRRKHVDVTLWKTLLPSFIAPRFHCIPYVIDNALSFR